MRYKTGDIVLVAFPFTNLKKVKKRPVLVINSTSDYGDIVCFQITSNKQQSSLLEIDDDNLERALPKTSYVKYDKCFTVSSEVIDKKISHVNRTFLDMVKKKFCDVAF